MFAAVFLLRLLALAQLTGSPAFLPSSGDTHFYDEWAKQIAAGHWTDHHAFYGLPLYAYWLAGLYRLFGYSPFVPGLIQAAADAGTATLLLKVSERVFDGRQTRGDLIGLGAAAAWALFVPAQAYSIILMPTALLVFAVWFLVWRIVREDCAPRPLAAFLDGVVIGVTAMAVATVLFVLPLFGAAIVLRPAARGRGMRSKAATAALLLAGLLLGSAPSWLHNAVVAHDPVFLSAHSGVNFWIGNNPEATGYPHFPDGLSAGQAAMLQDSIAQAEEAAGRPLKRSEVSAFWSAKAWAYIRQRPVEWSQLIGRKIANLWNAFQYDDLSIIVRLQRERVVLPGVQFGLLAALAIPGICFAWRPFRRSRWITSATLLQMAAVLPVFVTERYRLAAAPGLALLAVFGLWELGRSIAGAQFGRTAVYLLLLVCSTALVTWPRPDPLLWALAPYNAGRFALDAGDLDAAERDLKLAYAYSPQSAEVNFALGNLRLARGDAAGAESLYQDTLRLDHRHGRAFSNLGVLALRSGHPDQASDYLAAAARLEPQDAKIHFLAATAQLALNDYGAARAEIERAIALGGAVPQFLALRQQIEDAAAAADHGR